MKPCLALASIFLLGVANIQAQVALPDLTINDRGGKQSLGLQELSIKVRLEGVVAETILELEFFNHTDRRQEGEFVLQLPEGATVSTYALDINGHMRPGVAVEKGKARNAYESIKRRMVDPGLVEREEGNVYRTRIFPLEPQKPKRVRIGFIQTLPENGEYVFPLARDESIRKFSCTVQGADVVPELTSQGLANAPQLVEAGWWKWEAGNVRPDGHLRAKSKLPKPGQPLVSIDRYADGAAHFLVQGIVPAEENREYFKKWKKVRVIWDASYSRRWVKHEVELIALRRIWEWQGQCDVRLHLLGNTLGAAQNFHIQKGNEAGKELEQVLRETTYDGAADFSQIGPWDGITLLITDGEVSSPIWTLGKKQQDFFLITSEKQQQDQGLKAFVTKGINLRDKTWWENLTQAPTGIHVDGSQAGSVDLTSKGGVFTVSGQLPAGYDGRFTVRSAQDKVMVSAPVSLLGGESGEWNFSRRVWAQRKLQRLEKEGNRNAVTAFAKSERLVSDFTSLIILERFEDHVRYRIPPPEPDLLVKYQQAVGRGEREGEVIAMRRWRDKTSWFHKNFPWVDGELEDEIQAVSIWVQASIVAFPEDKLNKQALDPYQAWLPEAKRAVAGKDLLETGEAYKKWKNQLDQKIKDLEKIRNAPVHPDPDQLVHVSVRGFVNERGVYSARDPFSLVQAIKEANGTNVFGSLGRVYLYSAAQRTGYNLLSKKSTDVRLRWGDMIVVESMPPPSYPFGAGFADPFSDSDSFDGGGGANDAVFEHPGEERVNRAQSSAPSWADPFGNGESSPSDSERRSALVGPSSSWQARGKAKGINKNILRSLRDHQEPEKFYTGLLQGEFGKDSVSMATFIEMARFFFDRKQPDLAVQVLSNLCELSTNPIEATRSYAYWLAELGESRRGVEILEALVKVVPDEAVRALVYYDLGQISGKAKFFGKSVEAELSTGRAGSLVSVALTDYFGKGGKANGELEVFKEEAMPSDMRIVITSIGGRVKGKVVEPTGYSKKLDYGSRSESGLRVYEYQVRRALPGSYRVTVERAEDGDIEPFTIRATAYIRWASGKEEKKVQTLVMEGQKLELDDVVFDWGK